MTMLLVLAQAALAAAPAPVATLPVAPVAAPAQQGVISYGPEFFAAAGSANALEMVQRLPGFRLDTGDTVRGFEGAAGNALIDGRRPASKSDPLDAVLQRIPISKVARIDVIRGGAPGIDMQGKSVLANVVLKDGGGFRGLAAASLNYVQDDGRLAPSVRLEGSGGSNGRAWEIGLRSGRGVDDGAGPGPEMRIDHAGNLLARSQLKAKADSMQHTATAAYETPLFGGRLRLNGRLFADYYDYREVNAFTLPAGQLITTRDSDDKVETEIGARWTRDFGARTNLEAIGLRQTKDETFQELFDQHPGDLSDFKLHRRSSESIARTVLKFRQSERLSWELGGEGAFNQLDSNTGFAEGGVPVDLPAANVQVKETRGEGFVKAVWRPLAALTIEGAVREEGSKISSSGDVALEKTLYFTKPRVAVTWDATATTQLRARFEQVVGQLNFDDFVASASLNKGQVVAGNPNLNPEQAWVSEAAVEQRFWKGGAAVLTLRHSALTDTIDYAPVFVGSDFFERRDNVGQGTKDELIASLTLPLDKLLKGAQLRGEATWRRSEVTDPTTHRKREISALRPLEWEAHFTHDLPQWRVNWGVDAFGAWRETRYHTDQVEIRKLKTYVVPFAEWKPRKDLSVRLELGNVTARGFRNTRYVYDGPRGARPYDYVDDRDVQFGRMYYVRVRKTFGA
jgi:hypothetical protein